MEENYYYHSFNEELFRLAVKQYFVVSIYLFLSSIYLQLVLCFVRDKCIYDITLYMTWFSKDHKEHTMCNDQSHEPVEKKRIHFQSLMNCTLIGRK